MSTPATRLLSPFVLALIVFAAAVAGSPTAGAASPAVTVYFQHAVAFTAPGPPPADQEEIANTLEGLFQGANSSGWNIYISLFGLFDSSGSNNNDVPDRLLSSLAASPATVHVVMDERDVPFGQNPVPATEAPGCPAVAGSDVPGQWTRSASRLYCIAHSKSAGTFVRCANGCLGPHNDSGLNHNKFVLLSGPDGQRIVASSSANWTPQQLADEYQTMTVVRNDAGIFNSWLAYFKALESGSGNPKTTTPGTDPSYGDDHYYNGDGVDIDYFPRQGTNPDLTALQKVDCHQGGEIRIDTNLFSDSTIADQLSTMGSAGCTVKVLVNTGGVEVTFGNHVQLRCINNMHRKDMIVHAHYSQSETDNSVFTGSKPFARQDGVTDNALMRLQGIDVVNQFINDYDPIWAKAGAC